VIARIPPIHRTSEGSKTVSAVQQLRGTRLWRRVGFWRSRDPADGTPRDFGKEVEDGAEECSRELAKDIRDRGRAPFPDDEFIKKMAVLVREEDAPGRPLPEIPGFGEFCSKVLELAASDPKAAAKELGSSQKSKSAYRKKMPKLFMTVMQDEILRAYCQGMELLLPELKKRGFCGDRYSLGFFRFFHRQKAYLDGLVPDLHSMGGLLLRSKRFIDAAVRRFDHDASQGLPTSVASDFFGAIEAAAYSYWSRTLEERGVELELKKRKRTVTSSGSDLERLIHDNGMEVPAPPAVRRKRKAKKTRKSKKAKKAAKIKKTRKVKKATRSKGKPKGRSR
jgi:hypothetical protein